MTAENNSEITKMISDTLGTSLGDTSEALSGVTEDILTMVTTHGIGVLSAIAILVIGWWFAGKVKAFIYKAIMKIKNSDPTLAAFLSSLVRYVVLAAVFMAVLERFGVQTTSLIALLGAAGLAVGLALQGTLSNVAAGVMLLFFRPFKVGQFVDVGGHMGTVKDLSLFTTELATIDNVQIIIPNADVWGTPIQNYSYNKTRRIDIDCGIGYGDDIDKALEVMASVVEKDERTLATPAPDFFVSGLGDSSVNLVARFWVNATDYWPVRWSVRKGVKQAFDKNGIEIPFPQRVVHIEKETASEPVKKKTAKK